MTALPIDDAPRGFVSKAEHYRVLAENDRLHAELYELRERVATMLRPRYPDDPNLMALVCERIGCEPAQAATILSFIDGRVVARGHNPNATKQHLHYVRRCLASKGCPAGAIRTVRGVGYQATEEGRRWLSLAIPEATKGATP